MALVNHELKFVYLFEPHTASRATEAALAQMDGSKVTGNRHANLKELVNDRSVTKEQASEYRVFCTVRNPLDSFITRWLIKSHSRDSAKMLVDIKAKYIPMTCRGLHASATDHIWFEHLDEDIQSVFGVTMPEADPTHKNKHKKARWQSYYTNMGAFIEVSKANRSYMNRYGYRPLIIDTPIGVALDNHHRLDILNVRKPI